MNVSIKKIIKSDYSSLLSVIIPIVSWVIYLDVAHIGVLHNLFSRGRTVGDPYVFLLMAICSTLIFVPVLIARIVTIKNHFKNGVEVDGTITSIFFYRDRGRIEYEYELDNKPYNSGNAIHKSKFAKSLKEGQKVRLVVKKDKPNKALIREMYIEE